MVFRYDRDPIAHPENPVHLHVAGRRKRFPCDRVTLNVVAEKIWAYINERESLPVT